MKHTRFIAAFWLLALPVGLQAQLPQAPPGVKVEIAAQEAVVVRPVVLALDEAGVLHVVERQTQDGPAVLKALADSDDDRVFDQSRVVIDDLKLPSGLLIDGGWIYWTSGERLLRRRPHDANQLDQLQAAAKAKSGPPTTATNDGRWIEQELVRGLAGTSPLRAGGLSLGPDGWLYVSAGSGEHRARSWDGSQAVIVRSGAVLRMRPDGSQLHELARGLVQPASGVAFDQFGNIFAADLDWKPDAVGGGRLLHVLEGGDYGWQHAPAEAGRAADERIVRQPDRARAAASGERPGTLPPMLHIGSGAPGGLLVYGGEAFPQPYQGLVIAPDPDSRVVRAFAVERAGATFRVTSQFDLLQSDDARFRPCCAVQGPDGAIYVADCRSSEPVTAGTAGGGQQGRIYRLTWSGTVEESAIAPQPVDRWARIAGANEEALVALLTSADYAVQRRAGRQIVARAAGDAEFGARIRDALLTIAVAAEKPAAVRATALLTLSQLGPLPAGEVAVQLLLEKDIELVRLTAEAMGRWPPAAGEARSAVIETLKWALGNAAHPAVERALRLALGKLAADGDIDTAEWGFEATSVNFGPQLDRYVFDAHARALEMCPGAAKELMLGNLDVALNFPVAEPHERQRIKQFVVATAEAMRTRELAGFLDALLHGEEDLLVKMEAPLEARLIAAYQNVQVDPPIQADAVAEWLAKHPGGPVEVEIAAMETLSLVGTTKGDFAAALADRLLAAPDTTVALARRLLAGRLGASLRPQVIQALRRHAARDLSGEAARLLLAAEQQSR